MHIYILIFSLYNISPLAVYHRVSFNTVSASCEIMCENIDKWYLYPYKNTFTFNSSNNFFSMMINVVNNFSRFFDKPLLKHFNIIYEHAHIKLYGCIVI